MQDDPSIMDFDPFSISISSYRGPVLTNGWRSNDVIAPFGAAAESEFCQKNALELATNIARIGLRRGFPFKQRKLPFAVSMHKTP
jgi:hypothetical protein